ncbi:Fc.00g006210.m01.CDS01 [Cosmosporella sp. VM-42]
MVQPQRRGPWSNSEDEYLMQLVSIHGALNWVRIAQTLGSRTPKQCRERFHQNLKPTLNHDPITPAEGAQIEQLVKEVGKRWAEIARRLNGRSDNAVKNWWNGSQNRRKRLDRRRATQSFDDHFHRGGLSISTHAHPMPRTQSSPRTAYAHPYGMAWGVEAPLMSPCTSESAESELGGSNYTTSPMRSQQYQLQQFPVHSRPLPVELPPLRSASELTTGHSKLPSLSSLSQVPYSDASGTRTQLPPMGSQGQLPTAPNSPVQPQFQAHRPQQLHMGEPQAGSHHWRHMTKDSRMNVSRLVE